MTVRPRDYTSDLGHEWGLDSLPPVDEYVRLGMSREGVLGFVRAGTKVRFDRVVRKESVWDATLDYWGTIVTGEHAGTKVILDNLNVWDSGDIPRTPDGRLVESVDHATAR